MNLTGETQPLVEQLMMVKRMQVGGPALPPYPQGGRPFGGRREDSFGPSRREVSSSSWWKVGPSSARFFISPDVPGAHVRVGVVPVVSDPVCSPGAC